MFSYSLLTLTKAVTSLFYRFQVNWLSDEKFEVSDQVRVLVLLNHTSLFEPLFIRIAPQKLLRHISQRLVIPVADSTVQRPIVGKVLTTIVPGSVPISRKRDDSWQQFLEKVAPESLVCILPEGRMKRANGLDKDGNPIRARCYWFTAAACTTCKRRANRKCACSSRSRSIWKWSTSRITRASCTTTNTRNLSAMSSATCSNAC